MHRAVRVDQSLFLVGGAFSRKEYHTYYMWYQGEHKSVGVEGLGCRHGMFISCEIPW